MKNLNEIPVMFFDKFPSDFSNEVNGWNFTTEELSSNFGKVLTLDIDFGTKCSLNCGHCFRKNNKVDIAGERKMNYDDIVNTIKQAIKLGLRSVKFLGKGEPFENPRFIEFLRFLKSVDVIPVIFTKGHVIGDDNLARKYNSQYGINNGIELIEELIKLNASVLLGFNSFNPIIQDKMVGNVGGYTEKRNLALIRLIEAGFTKKNPTHLAVINTPINHGNCDEAFQIYKWARERGIYPVTAPSMISGRATNKWETDTPNREKMVDLYTKIYKFNLERGIQTIEQIKEEGISSYAGSHPCNQIACGMYVTLSGQVLRCPGDDVTVFGNVFEKSLEEIWVNSENFKRAGTFNCGCPPKIGKSIPSGFFKEVMNRVISEYKQ
ncbi:MAG: Radical SAM domain protein [Candidatus Nomurabacteria bacterium GW2011_GWB1_37_5]|uniref:Radical SAM domain protein n=1 Tax=Candidatus Nomurabacteria bacterium GW2011_GWB1_37_5 TaxID=1618742 RepID=A0A0G0GXY0_9BACT|nr:MAG: Radical SAM domain protein [Candidatus Nomurabacteria bacterium GW2011_GWB1_37_5]